MRKVQKKIKEKHLLPLYSILAGILAILFFYMHIYKPDFISPNTLGMYNFILFGSFIIAYIIQLILFITSIKRGHNLALILISAVIVFLNFQLLFTVIAAILILSS
jgi:hypothetical protein